MKRGSLTSLFVMILLALGSYALADMLLPSAGQYPSDAILQMDVQLVGANQSTHVELVGSGVIELGPARTLHPGSSAQWDGRAEFVFGGTAAQPVVFTSGDLRVSSESARNPFNPPATGRLDVFAQIQFPNFTVQSAQPIGLDWTLFTWPPQQGGFFAANRSQVPLVHNATGEVVGFIQNLHLVPSPPASAKLLQMLNQILQGTQP